jgi:hypothetical protein
MSKSELPSRNDLTEQHMAVESDHWRLVKVYYEKVDGEQKPYVISVTGVEGVILAMIHANGAISISSQEKRRGDSVTKTFRAWMDAYTELGVIANETFGPDWIVKAGMGPQFNSN